MEPPTRSSMKKRQAGGQLVFDENFATVDVSGRGFLRIEAREGEDGKG